MTIRDGVNLRKMNEQSTFSRTSGVHGRVSLFKERRNKNIRERPRKKLESTSRAEPEITGETDIDDKTSKDQARSAIGRRRTRYLSTQARVFTL